jgi:hypothetical protein
METLAITTALSPTIIEAETGFLVCDDISGGTEEVLQTGSKLQCQCFMAQVSDGECEHVRAVQDYLSVTSGPAEYPTMSQAQADVYLSRIAELDKSQSMNEGSAQQQIDRIRLWLEMESNKLDRQRAYYISALETWMHLKQFSTKQLVNGILKVRAQQPEIKINDEAVVLHDERFCRVVPEKRVVDKAALRKYVVSTGEEIEGTEVILRPPKFSYKMDPGVAL